MSLRYLTFQKIFLVNIPTLGNSPWHFYLWSLYNCKKRYWLTPWFKHYSVCVLILSAPSEKKTKVSMTDKEVGIPFEVYYV